MKKILLSVCTLILLFSISSVFAQETGIEINYDHSTGIIYPDTILTGEPVKIYLRYTNVSECDFSTLFNGFELSSPDGAQWYDFDAVPLIDDDIIILADFSIWPPGGACMAWTSGLFGTGWVGPASEDMGYLTLTLDETQAGTHIILDSVSTQLCDWVWSSPTCSDVFPAWAGPYEFVVANPPSCCVGMRGDVNYSGATDIADITALIDHLYLSHREIPCFDEADVNADGELDIADITCIITDMYLFNPCIQPCPGYMDEFYGNMDSYTGCKAFEKSADTVVSANDCVEYHYDGAGTLTITHINAGFNCCVDELGANISFEGNLITFDEYEINPLCYCLCLYDLEYTLYNIPPGTYTLTFIEPYKEEFDQVLEITIDLDAEPDGIFCIERLYYPWGYY